MLKTTQLGNLRASDLSIALVSLLSASTLLVAHKKTANVERKRFRNLKKYLTLPI
jgi:hypothetical protein